MYLPVIVNENDFYLYFEMFRQTEAKRVLDYGMFLRRIGAVARQVGDLTVPEDVFLTGVNLDQEGNTGDGSLQESVPSGVYTVVYDRLLSPSQLLRQEETYDLAFLLRVIEWMSVDEMRRLWKWLRRHATYWVLEEEGAAKFLHVCCGSDGTWPKNQQITVEQDSYLFLTNPDVPQAVWG